MTQPIGVRPLTDCAANNHEKLLRQELCAVFSNFAATARGSLIVAAPFITRKALEAVLHRVTAPSVLVLTTWKTEDVLRRASDPAIYPFLRSRGWTLRLCPTLHAKLVIRDLCSAIVSTANVTERGLGLAHPPNIECAVTIDDLSSADQWWILNLVFQSLQVTDAYYSAFTAHVASVMVNPAIPIATFDSTSVDGKTTPTSISLPVSQSPKWLVSRLESLHNFGISSLDHATLRDVLHDMSLFSLRLPALPEENLRILREKFFALATIQKLQAFLLSGRYFGEIKGWMRSQWSDGPQPTRQQLTRIVQVILAWFVELGEGQYILTRPHYSQCLTQSYSNQRASSP
jgi:hypothetical protein